MIAAAAAVLALAVGCTAYLAGAFVSLEDFAEDLFGGAPSQTEVIDKIGRPIGASAVSNGVAITADAVIGDNEHCVAVFSIARTDGMPIEASIRFWTSRLRRSSLVHSCSEWETPK